MENTMNITKKQFAQIVKESVSKSEVCRKLGIAGNGIGLKKVTTLAEQYNVDISHFSHKAAISKFQKIYERITKECPVCNSKFETLKGHKREKQTCSYSCSNTFFRSGEANPNYKTEEDGWGYRRICFSKWEKKCFICGFDKVVEVHHLDGNHHNNLVENLVPLCPNHHRMYHTKTHKTEVLEELKKITG